MWIKKLIAAGSSIKNNASGTKAAGSALSTRDWLVEMGMSVSINGVLGSVLEFDCSKLSQICLRDLPVGAVKLLQ